MLKLSSLETVYVNVPVAATLVAGGAYNPTNDAVNFCFSIDARLPASPTWIAGSWTGPSTARVLIGPSGGTVLAVGVWYYWVQVVDNPEIPILYGGSLEVS